MIEEIPPGRAVSIEREIFPELVGNGLYGYLAAGYWMDIGTPRRYLEGTWDLLAGVIDSTLPERDETGSLVYEGGLTSGAHIGPQAVVGHHCSVGSDSSVERAVLHDRVAVGADCALRECIVAEGARIGDGAEVRAGRRRSGRTRGSPRAPSSRRMRACSPARRSDERARQERDRGRRHRRDARRRP